MEVIRGFFDVLLKIKVGVSFRRGNWSRDKGGFRGILSKYCRRSKEGHRENERVRGKVERCKGGRQWTEKTKPKG